MAATLDRRRRLYAHGSLPKLRGCRARLREASSYRRDHPRAAIAGRDHPRFPLAQVPGGKIASPRALLFPAHTFAAGIVGPEKYLASKLCGVLHRKRSCALATLLEELLIGIRDHALSNAPSFSFISVFDASAEWIIALACRKPSVRKMLTFGRITRSGAAWSSFAATMAPPITMTVV